MNYKSICFRILFLLLILYSTLCDKVNDATNDVKNTDLKETRSADPRKEAGPNIGLYFAVFFGSVLVSGFIDGMGVFNNLIYKKGINANAKCKKERIAYEKLKTEASGDGFASIDNYNQEDLNPKIIGTGYSGIYCCITGSQCIYEFDPYFHKELIKQRLYYNCANSSNMYQALRSDYYFYILNENSLLGMFCCLPGHPFSRFERRLAFIVQHSVAFILTTLVSKLDKTAAIIINIFLIIPLKAFINQSFYSIVACPCLQGTRHPCLRSIFGCCEHMGSYIALLCTFISLIWFVVAGYTTTRNDKFHTLGEYMWTVFAIGQVVENITNYLQFAFSSRYLEIKFFCVTVFTIGNWYKDYIKREKLASKSKSICCLFPLTILMTTAEGGIVPIETTSPETPQNQQYTDPPKIAVMDHMQMAPQAPQAVYYAPQQPGMMMQQGQPIMMQQGQPMMMQNGMMIQQPGMMMQNGMMMQQPGMMMMAQQPVIMVQQQPISFVSQETSNDQGYDQLRRMIESSNNP